VFIGGGKGSTGADAITNGSVAIDLSKSTVDTKSLGLRGYQALGNSAVDIGNPTKSTSVSNILANTANTNTETQGGFTQFNFFGPGFSDTTGNSKVAVSVNLSGVTDAN